jgi:amino acid transporter
VLDLGGGPSHDRVGFQYWKNPGPFVQFDGIAGAKGRFLGFVRVLIQAAFSFIGAEVVTVCRLSDIIDMHEFYHRYIVRWQLQR